MHDIAFDGIHDEIAVTSPLAQAILSFRGAANGEEAPLRVIQGNKTQIKGVGATGKVSIDPVHDEIFLATPEPPHRSNSQSPARAGFRAPWRRKDLGF